MLKHVLLERLTAIADLEIPNEAEGKINALIRDIDCEALPIFSSLSGGHKPHLAFSIDRAPNTSNTMLTVYDSLSTLMHLHYHFNSLTLSEQRQFLIDFITEKLTP